MLPLLFLCLVYTDVYPELEERSSSLVQDEPPPPQHEERSPSLVQEEPQPPEHEERIPSLVKEEPEPPQMEEEADVSTLTSPHVKETCSSLSGIY